MLNSLSVLLREFSPNQKAHITIVVDETNNAGGGSGQEFTSQLYFDEAMNDRVLARPPYATKGPDGRTRNASDRIFKQEGGAQLVLALEPRGDGYAGRFNVAMHPGIKPEGRGRRG